MTARQAFRLGIFAIVAFALGLVVARVVLAPSARALPEMEKATLFPTPRPLPALTLLDQDARPLTTEFFKSRWTIVFFGFTRCPDLCPATLAMLAQARKALTALPAAEQPRVLLVSVDPERDTPQILKSYVTFFDPSFQAATGTPGQVAEAAGAFMVPYARIPTPDGGYTIDHGSGVYFVAPSAGIVAYSSPPLQPQALARDYRAMVEFYQGSR